MDISKSSCNQNPNSKNMTLDPNKNVAEPRRNQGCLGKAGVIKKLISYGVSLSHLDPYLPKKMRERVDNQTARRNGAFVVFFFPLWIKHARARTEGLPKPQPRRHGNKNTPKLTEIQQSDHDALDQVSAFTTRVIFCSIELCIRADAS